MPVTKEKAGDLPGSLARASRPTAENPADLRLAALAAYRGGSINPDQGVFDFLLDQLDRERPVAAQNDRGRRAGAGPAYRGAASRLAGALRTAGPLEVDRLLVAFEQSSDEALGLMLVDALTNSAAIASLRVDSIKAHLAKYGPKVQKQR